MVWRHHKQTELQRFNVQMVLHRLAGLIQSVLGIQLELFWPQCYPQLQLPYANASEYSSPLAGSILYSNENNTAVIIYYHMLNSRELTYAMVPYNYWYEANITKSLFSTTYLTCKLENANVRRKLVGLNLQFIFHCWQT